MEVDLEIYQIIQGSHCEVNIFCSVFHESWILDKDLSAVRPESVDEVY